MRTILLSFKADVYAKVVSGEKIYEHRKVFPSGPIKAYLYVSTPIKAIVGIMYLDNKIQIESWKQKYSHDKKAQQRIEKYLERYIYAIEIKSFQNTNMITLEQLRLDLNRFIVPQMYYYIDNTELLKYLEANLVNVDDKIINDFSNITSEMICKN